MHGPEIPNIELTHAPLNAYGWTAITIISLSLLASAIYWIYMYTKFKELGYYDHKQDIPIEFKPLKYLTLEEYISLLPKTPRTAPQAVLVELDRQGKIEITGSKYKRLSNKLTKCESDFLDALESQNDTAFEFIFKEKGIKYVNTADVFKNDWSTQSRLVDDELIYASTKGMHIINPVFAIPIAVFIAMIVFFILHDREVSSEANVQAAVLWISIFIIAPLCGLFLYLQMKHFLTLAGYTPKGIAVLNYYSGLKKYIKHVEKKRLDYFQDKHKSEFQELLPYLILFGMEKTWTNRLKRYERTWVRS